MKRLCFVVFWLLLFTRVTDAGSPSTNLPKTVRLLTIGNSFTQNATRYLASLAKVDGNRLVHLPLVVGGSALSLHWEKVVRNEKDSADPAGLYGSKRSLKLSLAENDWDYVTIQQVSMQSHDVTTYRPYAQHLQEFIKRHAPGAELLIHQTWAYRVDDPRFTEARRKPNEPATHEQMYQMLAKAYAAVAKELGVRRIPVGDAFYRADTNPQWGYKPVSRSNLQANPEHIPDQPHSLHVGWKETKQKDGSMKRTMDGHHANIAGEYLGSCVWYEILFGQSVVGNTFIPSGIDQDYARFLQETAHSAAEVSRVAPVE